MSSPTETIPPFGQMNLTCMWLETILYGMYLVLYGGCVHVLVGKRVGAHKILLAASTLSILIATGHVIISFLQLLHAFTDPAILAIPNGPDIYLGTNTLQFVNGSLYISNLCLQDYLLIWRFYVVWNFNWKFCIFPVLFQTIQFAVAITADAHLFGPGASILSPGVFPLAMTGWSMDSFINVFATCGIAYRLWKAGRKSYEFGGRYTYKSTMFMMIESGILAALCSIILLCLLARGNVAGNVGTNFHTQLASTIPFLIIVRVGYGLQHGKDVRTTTFTRGTTTLPRFYTPPQVDNTNIEFSSTGTGNLEIMAYNADKRESVIMLTDQSTEG
ncbi:hypothetical protein SERLA73DRAFT_179407 [Serpula lacrymans var. lacrymans S7.3]|uniref:Uncharacterized protein n=2 Tax=Serpula lacrymans var. lacrymans TaxID=341189 RepID=F8PS83_SERL3|nr:uncharacterized protein SERLADRAFT_464511 [Serpula lacrymans var. lacrymans S7.9]EGO01265.1 hypothetical protein SERLA73DRAFT_179407 [Serpula lacrymans var. lacrymans S7.3]EGO26906.1 hypothetical protein SERLADRAFT_464511 [Serpula lacrymans var. lacrymans S7.9]